MQTPRVGKTCPEKEEAQRKVTPGSGEPSLTPLAQRNFSPLAHPRLPQHASSLLSNSPYTLHSPTPTSKAELMSNSSQNLHSP